MDVIKPVKGNIVVSVNLFQKEEVNILGNQFKTGKNYNENFRERNPVVAKVEVGNKEIEKGSYIVCNYSYFDLESPLFMYDNLYSIPVNEEIYATINMDGTLRPVCGNLLVERVEVKSKIDLPDERKKKYFNQGKASRGTWLEGKYIFWLPYSDYEIVYQWNGEERRAIKIHENEITGYLKN